MITFKDMNKFIEAMSHFIPTTDKNKQQAFGSISCFSTQLTFIPTEHFLRN